MRQIAKLGGKYDFVHLERRQRMTGITVATGHLRRTADGLDSATINGTATDTSPSIQPTWQIRCILDDPNATVDDSRASRLVANSEFNLSPSAPEPSFSDLEG